MYRKMKVGGKIIITTPNYFYINGAFARFIYNDLYGSASGGILLTLCRKLLPRFFHRTMYLEVELVKREAGIQVAPRY